MQISGFDYNPLLSGISERNFQYRSKVSGQSFPSTQDTVSFSTEAIALAAEMGKSDGATFASTLEKEMVKSASTENSTKPASSTDKPADSKSLRAQLREQLDTAAGKNVGAGSSGGTSPEEELERIKKLIEKLQSQLEKINSSPSIPESQKVAVSEGINNQITMLTGLMNELGVQVDASE